MKGNVFPDVKHTWISHVPAAATAATKTIAADAAERWALEMVLYNYSEAPAAGLLTIVATVGGVTMTVKRSIITTAGPGQLDLTQAPIIGDVNTLISVTLASGGGTCSGEIHVRYH